MAIQEEETGLLSGRNGVIVSLVTPLVLALCALPALLVAFFVLPIVPFLLPILVWAFKRASIGKLDDAPRAPALRRVHAT